MATLRLLKQTMQRTLILLSALYLAGCSMMFISDYDQASVDQMQLVNKKIDRFFIELEFAEPENRKYSAFKASYVDISVELNALKTMQAVRPMNDLTVKQVDILLDLWKLERTTHQDKDSISNFLIKRHRSQYNRLLTAMIKGEKAKPVQPGQPATN